MSFADVARLLLLSAIWGSSFIFMRVLSPVLGPLWTAIARLLVASVCLIVYYRIIRLDVGFRKYWFKYLQIGLINSAIPFVLFSFAALSISGTYQAIFNGTAPLFGALIGAVWFRERVTLLKFIGLVIGMAGVVCVAGLGPIEIGWTTGMAIVACLVASLCYALAAIYIREMKDPPSATATAGMSQFLGGLFLLLFVPLSPMRGELTPVVIYTIIAFSVSSSAIAYLLYFKLIENIGATKALTVTFLLPLFGALWDVIFLGERITASMITGCVLILLGAALVLEILGGRRGVFR